MSYHEIHQHIRLNFVLDCPIWAMYRPVCSINFYHFSLINLLWMPISFQQKNCANQDQHGDDLVPDLPSMVDLSKPPYYPNQVPKFSLNVSIMVLSWWNRSPQLLPPSLPPSSSSNFAKVAQSIILNHLQEKSLFVRTVKVIRNLTKTYYADTKG